MQENDKSKSKLQFSETEFVKTKNIKDNKPLQNYPKIKKKAKMRK